MTKVEKKQLEQILGRLKESHYQEGRMDTIREVVSKLEKIVERS